ncbi:hypothetical protein Misp01_35240 [Microtetraspora sp. NBRC 13810]|nr:hypothetical protein Misp01_35240 [Microtetraspora sp. NBRC 13810]
MVNPGHFRLVIPGGLAGHSTVMRLVSLRGAGRTRYGSTAAFRGKKRHIFREAAVMGLNILIVIVASMVLGLVLGVVMAHPRRWDVPAGADDTVPERLR